MNMATAETISSLKERAIARALGITTDKLPGYLDALKSTRTLDEIADHLAGHGERTSKAWLSKYLARHRAA